MITAFSLFAIPLIALSPPLDNEPAINLKVFQIETNICGIASFTAPPNIDRFNVGIQPFIPEKADKPPTCNTDGSTDLENFSSVRYRELVFFRYVLDLQFPIRKWFISHRKK